MRPTRDIDGIVRPRAAKDGAGLFFVTGLAVAQLVSWGSLYYSFSLFIVPMEADLGWSRTSINGALSVGLLAAGLFAWPVGTWIDRHGGRAVMAAGSIGATLLLALWSQVDSLVQFYLVWIGLGCVIAATLYEPAFAVIARRFGSSYRSRMTVLTLVAGFASTVFIPLTQAMITEIGWRSALLGLASFNLAIALPIHWLLLRGRGDAWQGTKRPGSPGEHRAAFRLALITPAFWGLAVCFTGYYATFTALSFHLVPLLLERGVGISLVVAALAIMGPAQVVARLLLLVAGERADTVIVGCAVMLVPPVSALLLLVLPPSTGLLLTFAALYGGANGIITIVRGAAVPELFGREAYGAINGALALPSNVAKALAPVAAAGLWQAGGGYDIVLKAVVVGSVVAAVGFWLAAWSARHRVGHRGEHP